MSTLTDLTITEALDGLAKKDFSSAELTQAHVEAAEATRSLNAYVMETPDKAMEMAKKADETRGRGEAGLLTGVPIAVKDLFCTEGVRTTACSKILGEFVPPYESTVTTNMWNQGAVMLGKVNNDEFAMGSSNTTSAFGPVENPWRRKGDNRALTPGGSSGGSAAVVAARSAMGSLGTDTGGSIRQPAAFCGIVGLKPTYGRCSRFGIVAFASSLDQAGPFARTVKDTAILLRAMAGFDPKDSTSANQPVPDFTAALTGDLRGKKIGIPTEYRMEGLDPDIDAAWEQGIAWVRDAGAETVDISLPHTKYGLPAYYIIAPAEASSNLARYDGVRYGARVDGDSLDDMYESTRGEGFGAEVRRRILIGTYVLSAGYYDAYYLKAQRVRALIAQDFENAFKDVDAILTPSTPTPAFGLDEKMDDPLVMYLNDVFTVTANLAGIPGVSVPSGLGKSGLPLGLQVLGKPFDEETVLQVGDVLEKAAGFSAKPTIVAA